MLLRDFLRDMGDDKREAFAKACGSTVRYLRRAAYEDLPLKPATCVLIERESDGQVTRQDLRTDWRDIWPELAERVPA